MEATIMAIIMNEINNQDTVNRSSFMEIFSLKLGINKFGQKGYKSTYGEMLQIHQIICFETIKVSYLNPINSKRELESLIFLVEYKYGRI